MLIPAYQITGRRSTTRILVRVYCDANYYGTDCNTYCVARDDSGGHYTCDKDTGTKICRTGWRGSSCLTRELFLVPFIVKEFYVYTNIVYIY